MSPKLNVLVTGSRDEKYRASDGNYENKFRTMCERLGEVLAKRGHQLTLLSEDPAHADVYTLNGYANAARNQIAQLPAIQVPSRTGRNPEDRDLGAPLELRFKERRQELKFEDFPNLGEYPFNRVSIIKRVDVVLVVGGAIGAQEFVEIARALDKPIVPVEAFGGVAKSAWERLEESLRNDLKDKTGPLTQYWGAVSAERAERIIDIAETVVRVKREEGSEASAKQIVLAALLLSVALVLCILNWDNTLKLSPVYVRAMIFLVAGLSGATGAMLWRLPFLHPSLEEAQQSMWGTCILGLIIGCLSALIYLIAQESGFPELRGTLPEAKIPELKADYLAKLLPSAMVTALLAGMTLDRAYKSLLKRRPSSE